MIEGFRWEKAMNGVVSLILAGRKGACRHPLTINGAKPARGAKYRIVDKHFSVPAGTITRYAADGERFFVCDRGAL